MNFYDLAMSPLEFMFLKRLRKKVVSKAKGHVLEIGFGTGANTKFYQKNQIDSLSAIDIKYTDATLNKFKNELTLIEAGAEDLPFKDNTFDTVVSTIALCSVDSLSQSIKEIRRVLKDGGRYLFVEHVLPENKYLANFFNKFNQSWSKHMDGCNINRQPVEELLKNGFSLEENIAKNLKVFRYGIAINHK